ncbi:nitrate reductase cytochrome c-type subunit [Reinekea marinisedimentorum]|uniref:Periplasmic nitrate reductase, electron transfer subunit n=1 Tax=Reinekea marinisedimentorum TaxID=230495 RepID=A0A4R3I4H9_9GAMM|nr:nitrate reductase cytochrome c-type subunit [Reinekea marinisedimentorum]TCS40136.1 cytochrome c-type protein NapB [Reinekea marinisedimentorum]
MKKLIMLIGFITLMTASFAENQIATLRGETVLTDEPVAPLMMPEVNDDRRLSRDYPMAAPTIPHKTDGYRIDLNSNKCLFCHNRQQVSASQAPMISVTHFMNSDGNFLADVSPNRYFCNQCHVSQQAVDVLIENEFISMDELLKRAHESH